MKRRASFVYILIITLVFELGFFFSLEAASEGGRAVRVGIYNNPPLQSMSEAGKPVGFVVDILDYVAKKEDWNLEFVPCNWDDCLKLLAQGQIDILGAIAFSPERAQRFDFNQETVISNWGVIFAQLGENNIDITDMAGWTVAAIESDIHTAALKDLLRRFDINAYFLYVPDYNAAMKAVEANNADAAVVNHLFAMERQGKYRLSETSILFNPIEVHFATGKGANAELLTALDKYIREIKADSKSMYYQSLHQWFGDAPQPGIPRWVFWMIAAILGLVVLMLGGNLFLRQEIQRRTAELQTSELRFRSLIEQAGDAIFLNDFEGHFLEVNPQACESLGYSREELLTMTVADINTEFFPLEIRQRFWNELRPGEPVTVPGRHRRKDGSTFPVEIRIGLIEFAGQKAILGFARDVSDRVYAEAERERLLQRQNAVNRLALALGEYGDLDTLYQIIYEQVTTLMDAPAFIISLFNPDTQLIHAAFMAVEGKILDVSQFPPIPLQAEDMGGQSQVIRSGEPLYLPDCSVIQWERVDVSYRIQDDGRIVPGLPPAEEQADSPRSAMFAPMKIEGNVIGVMQVQSKQLNAYSQEDLESFTALANMAAIAVNSANLI
ncbi:MAG: transporter substrate-binding domain-containing protein, partial [Chloroflexi bacterium]|nr:transporter substrate-binding domain-containing protein [Chloroflexota bacterium]